MCLYLSVWEEHIRTALSAHTFMVSVLQLHSLSLMAWADIKESLMMKPSAPVSPALASIHYVHTTLFEYQAPIASNTTLQTPFFCFNYWPARFNSQHHGSASTNKLTSGPGTFRFIRTNWSMWSVLDAPMTVSLQCWCLQQMVLFWIWFNFLFFALFGIQSAISEGAQCEFPLQLHPVQFTQSHLYSVSGL